MSAFLQKTEYRYAFASRSTSQMPSAPRRTQTQPFDSPPAAAAKQAGRTQKKGKGLDAEIITSSAVSAFLKMLPTSTSWCGRPRGA